MPVDPAGVTTPTFGRGSVNGPSLVAGDEGDAAEVRHLRPRPA